MPAIHFQVCVREVLRHAPDVATYELAYVGRRPRFRPGQFIHLALDEYDPSLHWPESRVFSIASAPAADGLRLTISRQGRFTARVLDSVAVGQTLWCKGPYGEFEVRSGGSGEELVLIAGGTGITPFCAFMEQAALAPATASAATLFYGAREPGLLVYRELAERWRAAVPGARVHCFVERGEGAGLQVGRLDVDRIVSGLSEPARARFYLSGPRAMILGFRERLLQAHAISAERVLIDAWE